MAEIDLEGNVKNEQTFKTIFPSLSAFEIFGDPRQEKEGEELFLSGNGTYSSYTLYSRTEFFLYLPEEYLEKVKVGESVRMSDNSFLALNYASGVLALYELGYNQEDSHFTFQSKPVEAVPPSKMFFKMGQDTFCVQEKETNKILVFDLSRGN